MSTDTHVIVQDPVNARDLFDAACQVAGNTGNWTLHDGPKFADVHLYQTRSNPSAEARVSVHFPAAGGLYPEERGTARPDGYALVVFCTGSFTDTDGLWRHHADLVRKLGQWLDGRGIRWAWEFEDDPWIHGSVPAARGARA